MQTGTELVVSSSADRQISGPDTFERTGPGWDGTTRIETPQCLDLSVTSVASCSNLVHFLSPKGEGCRPGRNSLFHRAQTDKYPVRTLLNERDRDGTGPRESRLRNALTSLLPLLPPVQILITSSPRRVRGERRPGRDTLIHRAQTDKYPVRTLLDERDRDGTGLELNAR